jgi:teichuronic acid biosynthesis glycosyltransferase TuaC
MTPIRLLTFSTLFPNEAQPNHGIFVQNRLRQLIGSGGAVSTVLAPVPYFPFASERFGAWSAYAGVPLVETRQGLTIHHPRFLAIPKVGMNLAPRLLYRTAARFLARSIANGQKFDAIDAHYVYPDGVAAIWLGKRFGLPVVITARGTDISLIPDFPTPRRMIQAALADAAGLVGVSESLRQAMIALGADPAKAVTLRNGVNTAMFRPLNRDAARAALGLTRPTLISVGHLIERKGHHRTIAAMAQLPEFDLLIAGEGSEHNVLQMQIEQAGLTGRVRLLGTRPHAELPSLYSAADAMVLASSREGWANVLLESMACGTPVVASNIWGNPEVVQTDASGVIYDPNTPDGIVAGVRRLFAQTMDRAATRRYAEDFSWDATTEGQLALFRRVLGRSADQA